MKIIISIYIVINTLSVMAQTNETLPYYEIPEASNAYTAGTAVARMVDGLGFRYYWATENLNAKDLEYKISELSRTSKETIEHIYSLSNVILNAVLHEAKSKPVKGLVYEDLRIQTLLNFKKASDILKSTQDLSVFNTDKSPFWNMINGPIADAIWHSGQLAAFRRASGNPINSQINLFTGKVKK